MFSSWHNYLNGLFNLQDGWMGFDYQSLFHDPIKAKLTYLHELSHVNLSRNTEVGLATETIFRHIDSMKHLSKEDRFEIIKALKECQEFVQEGSATLVEIINLKKDKGGVFAKEWAQKELHPEYLKRYQSLSFVLRMSNRYKDLFYPRIPVIALHTTIRKDIVQKDLLSDPAMLIEYLKDPNNNPDERYKKLVKKIRHNDQLVASPDDVIYQITGVYKFADTPAEEVADFLNYISKLAGLPNSFSAEDIKGPGEERQREIIQISRDALVANMNINLVKNAIYLPNLEDILHYREQIEAILALDIRNMEVSKELDVLTGKKHEGGLILYLKTGEKFVFNADVPTISNLLAKELKDKTLIVKWGMFDPNINEVVGFPSSRRPDVVIYNKVSDLESKMVGLLKHGNKIDYLLAIAQEESPIFSLFLKDQSNILHLVNTFGNVQLLEFIEKYKDNLNKSNIKTFLSDTRHYNNVGCVWMDFDWRVDWYKSTQINDLVLRV